MIPNSAKVVAELDATLRELQLAQQTKTAADGHGNTALTGGDDGDSKPQGGARLAEMKSDVNAQQALSQQKVDGTAKSPVTGTAADVGTAEDCKSDNKSTKDHADDPGTENSDLSVKTAACLALGDELLKLAGETPEAFKEHMFGKKDDKKAPAVATAKKDSKELEKEAAAVDALLPADADLQKCAGVPDLPTDSDALQKVASDVVATYIQKCAEAYDGDVKKGFAFAANFHAGLAELEKNAAAQEPDAAEIAVLVKTAEDDAKNVEALLGGMGGDPAAGEGGEGPEGKHPKKDKGDSDGDEGGDGGGDADGDEGAQPTGGGEDAAAAAGAGAPPGLGGDPNAGAGLGGGDPSQGGMAAGGGVTAEQILAALQAAGIDPSMLAKTAAARSGLDERKVLRALNAISPRSAK